MFKILAVVLIAVTLHPQASADDVPPYDPDQFTYLGSSNDDPVLLGIQPGSRYFVSTNSVDWHEAMDDCLEFFGSDAHLVYLETQEEVDALGKYIDEKIGTVSSFWIGGQYEADSGNFQWTNGIPFEESAPWDDGHPDAQEADTKVAAVRVFGVNGLRLKTQPESVLARYCCETI